MGSVRQIVDANGNVTLAESYEPYGTMLTSTGTASSIFGYAGEQLDTTGLIYLRARYLNPRWDIFLARDPWSGDMMRPGSMNGFNYVEGNPVNRVDPNGEDWQSPTCSEGVIIHQMIDVDFLFWGSLGGLQVDVEQPIPGASKAVTGNMGYADLLDYSNSQVYEIKTVRSCGLAVEQAKWYNKFLNKVKPYKAQRPWTLGTLYLTDAKIIGPWPNDPDHAVKAQRKEPGAVIYWGVNSNSQRRPRGYPKEYWDRMLELAGLLSACMAGARWLKDIADRIPPLSNPPYKWPKGLYAFPHGSPYDVESPSIVMPEFMGPMPVLPAPVPVLVPVP